MNPSIHASPFKRGRGKRMRRVTGFPSGPPKQFNGSNSWQIIEGLSSPTGAMTTSA